jgi:uncharacterized cofD-like protein
MNKKKQKIVVIGGGTGTFTILSGLRDYPNLNLSVIVSMMDSGGSNRIIRDEFGLLPTSDLRQCMVALASSESNETLRKLFTYRYENGIGISGMTFGNLFMAALTDIYGGDQKKAIKETCKVLGVKGNIIPVTFEKSNLLATYSNGKQILGEHEIDEPDQIQGEFKITNLQVFPKVEVNSDAVKVINDADIVVLGPGDLYTTILPNIVIDGIGESIKKSKAKVVYVLNLMTKFGQTNGFKASDFVKEIKKYVGKYPDVVLANKDKNVPSDIIEKYRKENSEMVKDDLDEFNRKDIKIVRSDLISGTFYEKSKSDKLIRSLLRHDSLKLAKTILDL